MGRFLLGVLTEVKPIGSFSSSVLYILVFCITHCLFCEEGQLGYRCGDTQPTPRRVNALKSRIVAVAAANKHTAVISDLGEVFTWGCNKEGQLGYETPNTSSNGTPKCVDSLRGRVLINVATAKYHTIVLGTEGEV